MTADLDKLDALAAASLKAEGEAIENFSADAMFDVGQAAEALRAACDPATIRDLVAAVRERDEPPAPAGQDREGLAPAAWDVVLQQGRFTPDDEDNLLAVVPRKALDALRVALSSEAASPAGEGLREDNEVWEAGVAEGYRLARPDAAKLTDAIAYAIARAPVPGKSDTARSVAARLAPLVLESGYLAGAPDDREGQK